MDLIYGTGEIGWMTGVLIVGIVYSLFAIVWGKGKIDDSDEEI